jgi:hypothetical protein
VEQAATHGRTEGWSGGAAWSEAWFPGGGRAWSWASEDAVLRALASMDLEVAGRQCSRALPAHGGGGRLQVVAWPTAMELSSGPAGGGVAQIWAHSGPIWV